MTIPLAVTVEEVGVAIGIILFFIAVVIVFLYFNARSDATYPGYNPSGFEIGGRHPTQPPDTFNDE